MAFAIGEWGRAPGLLHPCYCGYRHTSVPASDKRQVLGMALGLLVCLFGCELTIALWSHSLSLLADAGHLLADGAALGLTLLAAWLASHPANGRATFGHQRIEVLAALVNGVGLLTIAASVAWEALVQLQEPTTVLGLPMLLGAAVGLGVNSLNLALLHQRSQDDLNLRAAFLHVAADAASAMGVLLASLAIYFWHWFWMDGLASLLVASFTGLSALPLLRESLEILLNYAPPGLEPIEVEKRLASFPGVQRVDSLRIWQITSRQTTLSAQLWVAANLTAQERDRLLEQIQTHLVQELQIQAPILQLRSEAPLHPLFRQTLLACVSKEA